MLAAAGCAGGSSVHFILPMLQVQDRSLEFIISKPVSISGTRQDIEVNSIESCELEAKDRKKEKAAMDGHRLLTGRACMRHKGLSWLLWQQPFSSWPLS